MPTTFGGEPHLYRLPFIHYHYQITY
ncbi:hypothetical protein [Staphylococcus aureus]